MRPIDEQHRALDIGHAVCRILDPEAEQQIDRAVAESGQVTDGRRRGEHALRSLRHLDGKFAHRVQIAVIGHAKRHIERDQQTRIRPVDRGALRLGTLPQPAIKFETIFCRPKRMPTPTAPLNNAKAVRSMPTALSPISSATEISAIRTRLPVSTLTEGLSTAECWSLVSITRASRPVAHRAASRVFRG